MLDRERISLEVVFRRLNPTKARHVRISRFKEWLVTRANCDLPMLDGPLADFGGFLQKYRAQPAGHFEVRGRSVDFALALIRRIRNRFCLYEVPPKAMEFV